jgi:hypothetical protein
MDVMYVISNRNVGQILLPLLRACKRRGTAWSCFFTDSGVEALDDDRLRGLLSCATEAVACEFSWERYRGGRECPVQTGSQTNHSAMVAQAKHVVSL